ncbi:MAG: RNA polymerase sigma factor [Ruminococcaceae bacterium]|nr:RNA polymerase sigma factor [Oscillospiraceae bacterium]
MLLLYLALLETEEDRAKITKIYETYLDWMLKMAYYYLKNEDDAEDAVNDVFLSSISGGCSIPMDNENETKPYLFICIRNSAFRIKKLKSKHKTVNFDELFNLSSKYDLEDEMIEKETKKILLTCINTLPPIYKDVLTLYVGFDRTLKEIAKELVLPFKTVETRFRRGRGILKERFGDVDL